MPSAMRKTTNTPVVRRLIAAAVALGSCLALAGPAGSAGAAPAEPVPTVFFGDSYTSNFGIAPYHEDGERTFCFRAKENYPAVATRSLADKGITLDVQADVSCGGALAQNFWTDQELLLPGMKVPPQQDALKQDTRLTVGSLGGNTLGFNRILKQCSDELRGHALLPGEPVDADDPAAKCGEFFESGAGKQWLDGQFEQVAGDLEELLDRIGYFSPDARRVLVGYPRLVPEDTTKCLTAAPGQTKLPFADIHQDALPVLDRIQKRLDDAMKKAVADAAADAATDGGADFVDLYGQTGGNTACDGANRGIGGLLEDSQIGTGDAHIPWYAHPNDKGRDIQAKQVAVKVEEILNR
ncbi:SGNH/GDSL hydrolase family protein [Streptomyces yaizuensis]|uniref:SGNH/GDSL hydrolase family protein n=1 Tax=Streptomyces yaizuensis TaxID=2989713 RepID=A0ABQ5P7U2_9ACTN|nr:SGNH/GDSL hydrolase family protein [Streptomyces sp. YSPA8]GLF98637.1 SGNH/GDSL hydrolase family protein [Streptomyces sp. YSPA8]